MPLNLASPGIVVKEIDLTTGRVAPSLGKVGVIVAPFAKGPVEVPTLIESENDLLNNFGEPYSTDKHYEHWLTASSYLAYGGSLNVVRSNDTGLKNGFVAVGAAVTSIKINSVEHYSALGYDENTLSGVFVVAKNPGSWANNIRVAIIDAKADQTLTGISTSGITVGMGITQSVQGRVLAGVGTTSTLTGYLKGIVSGVGASTIDVKVLTHVSSSDIETTVDYQQSGVWAFNANALVTIGSTLGVGTATTSFSRSDWFEQQTVAITTSSTVNWSNLAPRPGTSAYAADRNSRFDEVHVLVIDGLGEITGNAGTVLEKHLGLSKAKDAQFSVGNSSYWRKYLETNSSYIFGLGQPSGITTVGFTTEFNLKTGTGWDQDAQNVTFGACGNSTNVLSGGLNYGGKVGLASTGALAGDVGEISNGYELFENTEIYRSDFLLMGSASYSENNAQALANKLIQVAELRKDSIAFISPYRGALLSDTTTTDETIVKSSTTITDNLIQYYSPITSSSYAIFDSGYKYMYDRFNKIFRYVPLNGDIAGLCARNDINNFPWYSPAGTVRGGILNAVKLAYNPSKSQRDKLYSNRINPVIFSPGAGIVLFGDKTGLAKASAFDRINVRRLFVYLESAISAAAKDALFEFNDEITRTNFVNTVEPFLRDIQAKRGIFDYVVVCDETNNTAAVIDSNEFIADIYIKPARSINFIGLTFVATKTGVDFEEVIGNF